MVKRNSNFAKLRESYFFAEIAKRRQSLLHKELAASIINLGIGDTTEPIPVYITKSMARAADSLTTEEGYRGYGPEQGDPRLREKIASKWYQGAVPINDIFINDGAKCDIGRMQWFFGKDTFVAIQDPCYPAMVDSCVIAGQTGPYNPTLQGYEKLFYMPCTPENNFFPAAKSLPKVDLIYICSPNNPTGAVATREQLSSLVAHAKQNDCIILFDTAYGAYIQSQRFPKSIYEIPEADEVAIEMGSFSKLAGFSGLRLGWTVVPEKLCYNDGSSIKNDWKRMVSTVFNGASWITQQGGIACLEDEGFTALQKKIQFYLENAQILKKAIEEKGLKVWGGEHAPYLWMQIPEKNSWKYFDKLLERAHLITSPGAGFGPSGEGFIRLSAFGRRDAILQAAERLKQALAK